MQDSLVENELREIEQFINNFNLQLIVFREQRRLEVITDSVDEVHKRMRERFDTENAATVSVVGEGNITELYNVQEKYEHFSVIVFEVRETRSERGLDPVVSECDNLRPLNSTEIQNIDQELRESELNLNGLTKELYEDLQKFQVRDTER